MHIYQGVCILIDFPYSLYIYIYILNLMTGFGLRRNLAGVSNGGGGTSKNGLGGGETMSYEKAVAEGFGQMGNPQKWAVNLPRVESRPRRTAEIRTKASQTHIPRSLPLTFHQRDRLKYLQWKMYFRILR